ncbi:MAG TPA: ABC transporter permease [Acidobacteriaceae bacterium]
MRYLRVLLYRGIGLFRHAKAHRELEAELESHIRMDVEDKMRAGMSEPEARRHAMVRLGGMEQTRQAYRERGTVPLIENLLSDLRFAARQLYRNPGFAATAVFTLALGICASVAIFAFMDATLLRPLPYPDPTRLVSLFESTPSGPRFHLSYLDYLDWKRLNTVFSGLEAYDDTKFLLHTPGGMEPVDSATVSAGFFRTLGVAPVMGRDFRDGEDTANAPWTVLLSYSAWQQRFGGRRDVLGQTITLGTRNATIVGVLPQQFHFAPVGPAEFWTALHRSPKEDRGEHGLSAIARLKDGISLESASADMETLAGQLAKQYPDADGGRGATVLPLAEVIIGNLRPILLTLLAGAALLLLIACINIASLLLVRTEVRSREVAVRSALGASRFRLAEQFVTEALLLVVLGSSAGVGAALIAIRLLRELIPPTMMSGMPFLKDLGLNGHTVGFACAISLAAALLFSIVPIVRVPMVRISGMGTSGPSASGRTVASTLWRRLGANLVVVELATAMVLLVSAGLLAKSLYRLLNTEIGIQPEHLIAMRVLAPSSAYPKDEQIAALGRRILEQVQQQPWVLSSSISHALPIGPGGGNTTFKIIGEPTIGAPHEVNQRQVSPGYFTTLKARLLRGRFFTTRDDASKLPVTIINRTMARMFFPGEDPIGKHIRFDASEPPIEIVGIVNDVKEGPLDQTTRPALYTPFDQGPDNHFYVMVRTSQSEASAVPMLQALIHEIDHNLFFSEGESMAERIQQSPSAYLHRSSASLVSGFALLALLLGAVGLYGVLSYSVSQRTREIGVRMALGAQRGSVYRMILREAGWLTAAGILAGMVCAAGCAMLMRSLLFGVTAVDLPTMIAVAVLLSICAFFASYLPARRAASVNPMEALRAE